MCYGCWEELGKPAVVNGRTTAAVPLIAAVYDESAVGGNLHCLLDDWNLEDDFCKPDIEERGFSDAEARCAAAFAAMTEDERASALALYEGWLQQTPIVPE